MTPSLELHLIRAALRSGCVPLFFAQRAALEARLRELGGLLVSA